MTLTIKTNGAPRETIMGQWLPGFGAMNPGSLYSKLREQFDFLTVEEFDEAEFFKYKGQWYWIGDFMRVDSNSPFIDKNLGVNINWNGYSADSYFSGVLIRYNYDGTVIVGRYCS